MIDDWGYINARVRTLQGRLLGRRGLDAALLATSLEEFVAMLEATAYAAALDEALTTSKGIAGIEEGLRRDFQRTIDHVVHCAAGRPRELLERALGRWELFNVRTVLRGLHARAGLDAVASTIPFGRLDEAALQELARQADVKAGIDLLGQWGIRYASALLHAYPAYRERGDLSPIEAALDRGFFKEALRGLDRGDPDDEAVAAGLRAEIDRLLIGYALRAMHAGGAAADTAATFIPGGRTVTLPVFERLCATRTEREFLAAVPAGPLATCLQSAGAGGARTLPVLDRALHACFVRSMMRQVAGDPLSAAFAIGYLWLKANEIVSLRIIARGLHAGIPRADVEALIVPAG